MKTTERSCVSLVENRASESIPDARFGSKAALRQWQPWVESGHWPSLLFGQPPQIGRASFVDLRGTTQRIATGLGHWRRSCERRAFAITGTQPLPLFLKKALFGSGATVRPCVDKRDLPLSIERRLSLTEPRLCKAQSVGPGIVWCRIVTGRRRLARFKLRSRGQQKQGHEADHQSFIAIMAHVRNGSNRAAIEARRKLGEGR
ncbi:MAG TPA: hypothetical protein VFH89_16135 [Sphingomicrobium sp.]|nr:hypothetical protein [Sphingomicrobium sp.]